MTLTGFGASIDLHWNLLRPGRSRINLPHLALKTRQKQKNGIYVPGNLATTVIQLIHPAITEYTTARLIRVVDLVRWLRHCTRPATTTIPAIDETSSFPSTSSAETTAPLQAVSQTHTTPPSETTPAVELTPLVTLLTRAGLKTAAWAMLYWTRQWTRQPTVQPLFEQLTPGPLLRNYLKLWLQPRPFEIPFSDGIQLDPTTIYKNHPLIAKAGYSLMLNDTWTQRIRSVLDLEKELRKLRQGEES